MMDHPVFTLDLGSSKAALLAASLDDSGRLVVHEVCAVMHKGITRGVVTDIDAVRDAIEEAVRGMNGFGRPEEVIVNLGGTHLEGMNVQGFHPISPAGRAVTSADVLAVVNHSRQVRPEPDREQILALPREFRVDGEKGITKPIGLCGNRLEVLTHIITGQVAHLRNLENAVNAAGLRVAEVVPSPVASGMALLSEEERRLGAVVVDIGSSTTDIAIFANNSVAHCVVLPIGSGHVTNDLSKLLKMSPEEADQLKRKHGRALAVKKNDDSTVEVRQIGQSQSRHLQRAVLFEIIESRMREMATMVAQQVEKSGLKGTLSGGIVLTGGGSLLPGTPQLFGQVLSEPNSRLGTPRVEGPAAIRASGPEWSVAVGMAAYALENQTSSVEPAIGLDHWKERIRTFFQLKV